MTFSNAEFDALDSNYQPGSRHVQSSRATRRITVIYVDALPKARKSPKKEIWAFEKEAAALPYTLS